MVPWWCLIIAALIIVFAVWVKPEKHPCSQCEIYLNPDSDYRHCFDCKKVNK